MSPRFHISFLLLGGGLAVAAPYAAAADVFPAGQIEFFEKSVRPVLAEHCYDCHGPKKHENGLRLDSREAVLRGSEYGLVVEAGKPVTSKLIKAIHHAPGVEPMPKKGPMLKLEEISALEQWVQMGLPWPEEKATVAQGGHAKADPKSHWAFQPVKKPILPQGAKAASAANWVDALVSPKLHAAGLDFAPMAEPAALCRRIAITLTGLQPSYEEVQAFVAASAKNPQGAAEAMIDRLLSSPAYGERWARHWLDVVRYADTSGYTVAGKSNMYPYAYTYRDWVVKAFNDDMPYDQFLTYQLAADKLVPASFSDGSTSNKPEMKNLPALAMLNIGDRFISDKVLQMDDRIDVVSRGMLGLTVACARCHDHKYDAILSKDYYALYSVFNSCEEPEQSKLPIIGESSDPEATKDYQGKVAALDKKELDYKTEVYSDIRRPERLAQYLAFAQESQSIADNTAFRGRAGQLKLRDRVAEKWKNFVKRYALADKPSPVMLAWKEFSALPKAEFAQKAPALVQQILLPAKGLNGVARNELAKRPAPKSMDEVAGMYAQIFLTCLAGTQPENEDWKQVRELLQSDLSPMAVPVDQADVFFTRQDLEAVVRINNERVNLESSHPGAPPRAMVTQDKPKPTDMRVFVRGNPARQGDAAPRAYLSMFGGQKFTEGSGRLELAKLIANKDNPLTARVIVNRVWASIFGKPLVSQTSDFGVQTPKPVQAELLDYLAATLMEENWSLKKLNKRILTSRTFLQSSQTTPEKELKDADNELLSRFNRQRLDYEGMRDALLQASGDLNVAKTGGRAVALNDKEADTRRTLYLLVDRYEQATVPAMFDFANPDAHSPVRYVTNVPQQTLFLMNSPFMNNRAGNLAAKTPVQGSAIDSQTIQALFHRVLLRDAKPEEVEKAQRFVQDAEQLSKRSESFVWKYGTAQVEKDPGTGRVGLTEFEPFTHFVKVGKSTVRWQPAEKMPDKVYGHLFVGAGGGHPGDKHPLVMQWTSPFEKEKIRLSGTINRPAQRGNGIRCWLISSRTGLVREEFVKPTGSVEMKADIEVRQGEVISFVVGDEGSTDSDSFAWIPKIERIDPMTGAVSEITKQDSDFCGKDGLPIKRPKPQSILSQLGQVLMMSNEFQFVD